jgi:mannose-6-phosphate isomerase-like protein (cupin superfamily)
VALLTPTECTRIAAYLRRDDLPAPAGWWKGRAVHERFLYELATRPAILEPVVDVLGGDVVLWGVSAVRRTPGEVHPWHSDTESCAPEGGFVSVWIGIEHTSRDSSLQLIGGSHRFGTSVQEIRAAVGMPRDEATPEALLPLARKQDPRAELVVPDMGNGEAILFDGRLWHGTDNRRQTGDRLALLIQFAAADRPVRIPDPSAFDWPFRFLPESKPPVILVRGTDRGGPNVLVPPPPLSSRDASMLETAIHPFELPLSEEQPAEPWLPFPAFSGPTPIRVEMSCHASVLQGGHMPHPPHAHVEEELLIPLHGEVELIVPSGPSDPRPRSERLAPDAFVYYPSWQLHTIRNPGTSPVAYLMFKWRGAAIAGTRSLGTEILHYGDTSRPEAAEPFWSQLLFEGPTGCLEKLHAHVTILEPGAEYEPHRDAYDVAIVTLEGTVETLGQRVEPRSVIYYGAGELHGMRNIGAEPARYLVFELHAAVAGSIGTHPQLHRRFTSALLRAGKRLTRPLRRRIRSIRRARARLP